MRKQTQFFWRCCWVLNCCQHMIETFNEEENVCNLLFNETLVASLINKVILCLKILNWDIILTLNMQFTFYHFRCQVMLFVVMATHQWRIVSFRYKFDVTLVKGCHISSWICHTWFTCRETNVDIACLFIVNK